MIAEQWYAVRVTIGKESSIANNINETFPDVNIMLPTEDVVIMRKNKPSTTKRKMYPGYVMLNLKLDQSLINKIENFEGVYGFVGGKDDNGDPYAIPEKQFQAMVSSKQEKEDAFSDRMKLEAGDKVRVVSGPFVNFHGVVEGVYGEKIKIMISVFGKQTSLYLGFLEVERDK